uniref:EF-hand domain-containing protein n=1 Tax=Prymnesium polylepis TaxID=72548 RepID=A0A7S4MG16_9EUKA
MTHDQLQRAFGYFDLSTNGAVEPKELVDGMVELGGFNRQAVLVTKVLGGRLGRVISDEEPLSQMEFRRVYTDAFMRHKVHFREEMVQAFSYFDTDASGALEYDELLTSFRAACPFHVTDELFGQLFAKIDANGDGVVSVDEFVDYLIHHAVEKACHDAASLTPSTLEEQSHGSWGQTCSRD